MVQPLSRPKVIKKYTKRFKRHQYDRKIAVKVSRMENLQPLRRFREQLLNRYHSAAWTLETVFWR